MQQEKSIREQLIEFGLWDANDPRDPYTDQEATTDLKRRCEQTFGFEIEVVEKGLVRVYLDGLETLAAGNIYDAVCCLAFWLHQGKIVIRNGRAEVSLP